MAAPPGEQWVENRASRGIRLSSLAELWAFRNVVGALAGRDFRVRYKQAVLGVAWAGLQPLVGLLAFTLVFNRLAGVSSEGVPYPLFALVGLAVWNYNGGALAQSSVSLVANASLVTKVYFPRIAAPLASMIPPLVDLGIALALVGGFMVWYGFGPPVQVVLLPAALLALVLTTMGPSLWLSALNVRYRDVKQGVGLLVQLWLFASPVAYPAALVDEDWRTLYFLNPMAGVLELTRWCVLGSPTPTARWLLSLGVALALLAGGLLHFLRVERRFADVV